MAGTRTTARALGAALALSALLSCGRPAEASLPTTTPSELALELSAYDFAARAENAAAIFANPAGLAGAQGMDLVQDVSGGTRFPDTWTTALQGGPWAFGYTHRARNSGDLVIPLRFLDPATGVRGPGALATGSTSARFRPLANANVDAYVLAVARGPRQFRLGISREWANVDARGHDLRTWNVGVLSNPWGWITLGGTMERLDSPRYLDGKLRPLYTYGISARPPLPLPARITLDVQGSHRDGGGGRIDMLYGASIAFDSGVDVALTVQDPNGASPGVGIAFTRHLGHGAVTGRARSVGNVGGGSRASFVLEAFDEFWRRTHGSAPQGFGGPTEASAGAPPAPPPPGSPPGAGSASPGRAASS